MCNIGSFGENILKYDMQVYVILLISYGELIHVKYDSPDSSSNREIIYIGLSYMVDIFAI